MTGAPVQIELNYGQSKISTYIPTKNFLGTILPADVPGVVSPIDTVRHALSSPIGSPRLRELAAGKSRIMILVSDITRPSPSRLLLPPILEELAFAGIQNQQISILFGLGVHRRQTETEQRDLVGDQIFEKIVCIDHDRDDCVEIGTTSRGAKVAVFRRLLAADLIIATGNLEYHYFAGYSGGAKALAPGFCSRDTIEANHCRFLDPGAVGGRITGNPLREELEEMAALVGIDFLVNAVLNQHKEITHVVAGDVTQAHRAGVGYIDRIYRKKISRRADIIITSPGGYPKDMNLYQSHKAMQNAKLALKPGGILLITAKCQEGLGEENFARAFEEGLSLEAMVDELRQRFIQGRHIALQMAKLQTDYELFMVTDLPEEIRQKLFFRSFISLDAALETALKSQGENAQVLVMPYGISTLPYYCG